jgi:hypothetical protein
LQSQFSLFSCIVLLTASPYRLSHFPPKKRLNNKCVG